MADTAYIHEPVRLTTEGRALRDRAREICARALHEGRRSLTELEGMTLLTAMGIRTPRFWLVQSADAFLEKLNRDAPAAGSEPRPGPFPGAKAVVKVISPDILHKTEAKGVEIVENTAEAIVAALRRMEARFATTRRDGFTVNEFVAFEAKLGHEMIFGYRFAPDFGPVVSFGPGGIYTEYLATKFAFGAANLVCSPRVTDSRTLRTLLQGNVVHGLL
ncbi:MAG: acetate--CoA ligase family protein, partial [Spirochaetales bacterium]|nr:acetate--CoA ligase family protein [Spirochaetales bacterium]